jgi:hypothetical protein
MPAKRKTAHEEGLSQTMPNANLNLNKRSRAEELDPAGIRHATWHIFLPLI